ncbi:MAG: hypothetical protein ABIK83_14025, partial [Candidatus Zixiibacteriota bacterium]
MNRGRGRGRGLLAYSGGGYRLGGREAELAYVLSILWKRGADGDPRGAGSSGGDGGWWACGVRGDERGTAGVRQRGGGGAGALRRRDPGQRG